MTDQLTARARAAAEREGPLGGELTPQMADDLLFCAREKIPNDIAAVLQSIAFRASSAESD